MKWYSWVLYILVICDFAIGSIGYYVDGERGVGTLLLLCAVVAALSFVHKIRTFKEAKSVADIKPSNLPESRPVSPYEHSSDASKCEAHADNIQDSKAPCKSHIVLNKEFHVVSKSTGELYTVKFSNESGKVQAHCSCRAGIFGTLCKHVIEIMETDGDVKLAMKESGQASKWDHYLNDAKNVERMKKELSNEKKAFAKDLLYIER